MFRIKILLFVNIFLSVSLLTEASESADSLLLDSEQKYHAYLQFRSTMGERTWLNLVELDKKANNLIVTDRLVIENLIGQSEQEKKHHAESTEILKLEKALLERDKELTQQELNKKTLLQRNLSLLFLLTALLVIISFFFLASYISKHRTASLELERLYSGRGDLQTIGSSSNENALINQKLSIMKENNEQLNKELSQLANEKSVAIEALKKEIRDRKKMEQEIKSLIEQVKRQ